eukprot:418692-Pelagomonas_calceolata.AAC.3
MHKKRRPREGLAFSQEVSTLVMPSGMAATMSAEAANRLPMHSFSLASDLRLRCGSSEQSPPFEVS